MSLEERKRIAERKKMIDARLGRESVIWLATVGNDDVPHLVPVYYIWLQNRLYLCTSADTQEWNDLHDNQNVTLSLPDPFEVVVIEGEAHAVARTQRNLVADYFLDKYDWNINERGMDYKVVEITPKQIMAWGDKHEDLGIIL